MTKSDTEQHCKNRIDNVSCKVSLIPTRGSEDVLLRVLFFFLMEKLNPGKLVLLLWVLLFCYIYFNLRIDKFYFELRLLLLLLSSPIWLCLLFSLIDAMILLQESICVQTSFCIISRSSVEIVEKSRRIASLRFVTSKDIPSTSKENTREMHIDIISCSILLLETSL